MFEDQENTGGLNCLLEKSSCFFRGGKEDDVDKAIQNSCTSNQSCGLEPDFVKENGDRGRDSSANWGGKQKGYTPVI